jgi:hypothetical protein
MTTEHTHSDGITYFCNKDGCTQIKSASTAKPTVTDYNELLRKYHALEGVLATTQYRNSQLQAQVDNNGEGPFKDYKDLQDCIDHNVADGSSPEDADGMYMIGGSLYGKPIDREENNLKSANVENEGTLIGTSFYGKNRPSNTITRVVN